jgi:hypothetical protein
MEPFCQVCLAFHVTYCFADGFASIDCFASDKIEVWRAVTFFRSRDVVPERQSRPIC